MRNINATYFLIFIGLLFFCFQQLRAEEQVVLQVDFTADSVAWKSKLPTPQYNADRTIYSAEVTNLTANNFKLSGDFGRFAPAGNKFAQPLYIENMVKRRRWAFRLAPDANSYLELPELSSVGRFTVFCKNANPTTEASMHIQKYVNNQWQTIKTVYIPPHHNQNYELQMEEFLATNQAVKLRLVNPSERYIHIYEIRAHAYDAAYPKNNPLRIILLPDPQAYANREPLRPIYGRIGAWLNNIADEIDFVICQGDMTQNNNDEHWSIAAGAFNMLEGRNIPFAFCAGNHDMGKHADSRDTQMMNKYLPYARYSRHAYFGGTYEVGTVDNTWQTFTKDGYKFLILNLEWVPRNKIINWAKTVIEQHPKHNVIINTHSYLNATDGFKNDSPQPALSNPTGDEAFNGGEAIWNKLVSQYPNVLFVFSGHVTGDGTAKRITKGVHGNTVYQFMANYQGGVDGTQEERNGMNRIIDIDLVNKSFTIQTYSDYQKRYNTALDQVYYFTNVNFIKDGVIETPAPEPTGILSEDFSTAKWANELLRLNPGASNGTPINPNATNTSAYSTPDIK